ncbi:uncharacterized membrane protein YfbV (UPF0208 family) [Bradyrhizobium sp. AZCC 1678]
MRLSKVAALALIVGATGSMSASPALACISHRANLICDGYWWIGAKATRTVAPKALAAIWF